MPSIKKKHTKRHLLSDKIRKISTGIIIGLLATIAIPTLLVITPSIIGVARVIQNTRLWLLRTKEKPTSLAYSYQPNASLLKQALTKISQVISPFLKIAFFPLYVWGLGVNVIIGYVIYPKSFVNPFKSLRYNNRPCQLFQITEDTTSETEKKLNDERPIFILKENTLYYKSADNRNYEVVGFDTTTVAPIFANSRNKLTIASKEDLNSLPCPNTQDSFPFIDKNQFIVKEFAIGMPNSVQLQTCEIQHKSAADNRETPCIIYFGGNGATFLNYKDAIIADALTLNARVIGFHHSSFGRSGVVMANGDIWHQPVSSHRTLVEEGIAQVQRLLDSGVPAEKITLYGHSLGGTIATAVAYHFHHLKIPQCIYVFNDRSLTSPTAFITAAIAPEKPIQHSQRLTKDHMRIALAWVLQPIIKLTVMLSGWDFDASSFAKIPEEYRQYLVVRGKTDKGNVITDEIIPDGASVRHLNQVKEEYKTWKGAQPADKKYNPHKFYKTANESQLSHECGLSELTNRGEMTGQEYWHAFVRRS